MSRPAVAELLALDVETRLEIVEELWNSIVDDPESAAALPVSASDRHLLEERLKEDDADPDAAIPWSVARELLLRGR